MSIRYVTGLATACQLLLAGCAGVPFEPVERISMDGVDPAQVRARFSVGLPLKFDCQNTVIFEYFGRKVAALGFGTVDVSARAFTVVCMTPMGVKLFEVVGKGDSVHTTFALPDLAAHGDLAQAVGQDVRRIYFDLVPPDTASVSVGRTAIVYEYPAGDERTEYVFGGREGVLLEKRCHKGGRRVSTVAYYDYREEDGKRRSYGVVLTNHPYGYRLIVRDHVGQRL
jgi:hypothetical protein